jgi:Zn-finger domain-containing protein
VEGFKVMSRNLQDDSDAFEFMCPLQVKILRNVILKSRVLCRGQAVPHLPSSIQVVRGFVGVILSLVEGFKVMSKNLQDDSDAFEFLCPSQVKILHCGML